MHADRTIIAAVIAMAIVVPTAQASAWCQMTSSQRSAEAGECIIANPPETFPLAWRHRCTSLSFSTMGSSQMTGDEVAAVFDDAIVTWESVLCDGRPTGLDVEILPELNACTGGSHFTGDRNVHTVVFIDDEREWWEVRRHARAAYAVTLIWHDQRTGEIWDVDMEINETKGRYRVCDPLGCSLGDIDLPNVITHEMGHYFGLAHTPDDSLATMWASAGDTETLKRDLRDDDIAGLCAIYPPGSLPEECDPTPRGGLNLECVRENDGGCGCSAPGVGREAGAGTTMLCALAFLALAVRRRRRR